MMVCCASNYLWDDWLATTSNLTEHDSKEIWKEMSLESFRSVSANLYRLQGAYRAR